MSHYSMGLMVFFAAAAVAGALTPTVIQLAKLTGALDRPVHRKAILRRVVPTLGGLAIFGGVWGALLLAALLITDVRQAIFVDTRLGMVLLVAGASMVLIGLLDDRLSIRPRTKLLVQLMVALGVVASGLTFERVTLPGVGPIELQQLAIPLTVLWIVGVTNALNLIDGIDGLASGITLVVALTVAAIALVTGNIPALILAAALAGGCAGFLPYNFSPARIFLGDSGSLFLGSTLAIVSLASSTKAAVAGTMLVPVLLLAYPTLDTLLVMARRFLKGKPILAADRDHIHHRLLARGLSHAQSSVALYAFCVVFCLMALGASTTYHQFTLAGGLVVVTLIVGVGSMRLGYFSDFAPRQVRRRRYEFLAIRHRYLLARAEIQLAETPAAVLDVVRRIGVDFGMHQMRIQMRQGGRTRRWLVRPEGVQVLHVGSRGNAAREADSSAAFEQFSPHRNGAAASGEALRTAANGSHAVNGTNGQANGVHSNGNGAAHATGATAPETTAAEPQPKVINEKLRFPATRMTARVELVDRGGAGDTGMERRIYLCSAIEDAGRRLAAIATAQTQADAAPDAAGGGIAAEPVPAPAWTTLPHAYSRGLVDS